MRIKLLILLFSLGALPLMAQLPKDLRVPIRFNRYHTNAELGQILASYAEAFPDFVRVQVIGKSHEGRELQLATLQNSKTGPESTKAAMYIDANVHGNEIQGAEVCLYTIALLLENYGKNERLTKLLNERVFYILPSVNPDGRDFWLEQANNPNSSRSGARPVDSDRDGLADEDGPNDLDGDGSITTMRKFVPGEGQYKLDPEDKRFLVRVRDDEKGDYIFLGSEGLDDDSDGRINEDGPGGYDMNRNNPTDWQPDYIQFGAGSYPFSEPETRAVGSFLLSHPNIASVQSYHNHGGMILRGPGSKDIPDYPRSDLRVYDQLGRDGEKILPFYRYMILYKDLYTVHGGFVNFAAEGLGVVSFTNELWNDGQRFQGRKPEGDERKVFNDLVLLGGHYRDWQSYQHPTLGEIEIGGWTKESSRVNPTFMLEETCHRNTAFTLIQAEQMPKIVWRKKELTELSPGLFRLRVSVENKCLIPSRTAQAAEQKIGLPDFLILELPATSRVIAASEISKRGLEDVRSAISKDMQRLRLESGLGSYATREFEWLIEGPGLFQVRYQSEKGGRLAATFD